MGHNGHGIRTRAVHGGHIEGPGKAVVTPIVQSTTYQQQGVGKNTGFTYSRDTNPTISALEAGLGALELGEVEGGCVCTGTGMGAITTLLMTVLEGGGHVVVSDVVYGGTVRLVRDVLSRFGVEGSFVDTSDAANVAGAIRQNTKLVFIETPANPTMKLSDIGAVCAAAHGRGVPVAVDNTFLTPALQRPIEFGADIVVHSTTKYIEGHNATTGGAVICKDAGLLERLREVRKTLGTIQKPFEGWLTIQGLKTLPWRIAHHSANALEVGKWLAADRRVKRVWYPWLEDFEQKELARAQQEGGGGMLSFELEAGYEGAKRFLELVELCTLAENLGAVETLITHPASMTHGAVPADERERLGIHDGLIRLSVGLEDAGDIVADLERALDALEGGA